MQLPASAVIPLVPLLLATGLPTLRAQNVEPKPAPARLERRLLEALAQDDVGLRVEAIGFLGTYGAGRHVAAIGALAGDPDHRVRAAAYRALGSIWWRDRSSEAAVAPLLGAGLRDGVRDNMIAAIGSWPSVFGDCADLEACLADPAESIRLLAATTLIRVGHRVHRKDLRELLAGGVDRMRSFLLVQLDEPADRPLLAGYLASDDLAIRQRAADAGARLDAIERGEPRDWLAPAQRRAARYREQNEAGLQKLLAMAWYPTPRQRIRDAAAGARLLMFGEMHHDEPHGPLRIAQRDLLKAFAGEHPEHVVLGYEPSVERAQRSVIDHAQSLGIATRSLEPSFRELLPRGLHPERDDEVAAAITACLAESPERRMFVIRGESHTVPDGYLCRQLPCRPMIVLSSMTAPLDAFGDEPTLIGRTFRLGDDEDLFHWSVWEPALSERFAAWLAK